MEIKFEFQGTTHKADAEVVGTKLWIHFNGRTIVADRELRVQKKGQSLGAASPGKILAPMPGKVTKLLVQPGQPTKQGDVVLVMEAMKMEYTLKADIEGVVEKISCAVGDQVALGKVLITIKEAK